MNIRNRLINVLYEDGQRPKDTAARLADAVLNVLGLRKQFQSGNFCYESYPFNVSLPVRSRYVTKWVDDVKEPLAVVCDCGAPANHEAVDDEVIYWCDDCEKRLAIVLAVAHV